MSLSGLAVPTFVRLLGSRSGLLDKAATHTEVKKIDPAATAKETFTHRRWFQWLILGLWPKHCSCIQPQYAMRFGSERAYFATGVSIGQ